MRIPDTIRRGLREKLWALADELDWSRLSWHEKSAQYEIWTRDPEVGQLLSNYMDQRQIRVYIKDTIMKGYVRSRLADRAPVLRSLGIAASDGGSRVVEVWERPHGFRLADGKIVVWSKAKDWKAVLMVTHERAFFSEGGEPYASVLFSSVAQFSETPFRQMVEDAGKKLGIQRIVWLE